MMHSSFLLLLMSIARGLSRPTSVVDTLTTRDAAIWDSDNLDNVPPITIRGMATRESLESLQEQLQPRNERGSTHKSATGLHRRRPPAQGLRLPPNSAKPPQPAQMKHKAQQTRRRKNVGHSISHEEATGFYRRDASNERRRRPSGQQSLPQLSRLPAEPAKSIEKGSSMHYHSETLFRRTNPSQSRPQPSRKIKNYSAPPGRTAQSHYRAQDLYRRTKPSQNKPKLRPQYSPSWGVKHQSSSHSQAYDLVRRTRPGQTRPNFRPQRPPSWSFSGGTKASASSHKETHDLFRRTRPGQTKPNLRPQRLPSWPSSGPVRGSASSHKETHDLFRRTWPKQVKPNPSPQRSPSRSSWGGGRASATSHRETHDLFRRDDSATQRPIGRPGLVASHHKVDDISPTALGGSEQAILKQTFSIQAQNLPPARSSIKPFADIAAVPRLQKRRQASAISHSHVGHLDGRTTNRPARTTPRRYRGPPRQSRPSALSHAPVELLERRTIGNTPPATRPGPKTSSSQPPQHPRKPQGPRTHVKPLPHPAVKSTQPGTSALQKMLHSMLSTPKSPARRPNHAVPKQPSLAPSSHHSLASVMVHSAIGLNGPPGSTRTSFANAGSSNGNNGAHSAVEELY